MHIVRANYDVNIGCALANFVSIFLSQATGYEYLAILFFGLPVFQLTERAIKFVVSVFANATSVDDNNIGSSHIVDICHAVRLEQTRDAL